MTNEDAVSEIIDITSSNMTYKQMIDAIKEVLYEINERDEEEEEEILE